MAKHFHREIDRLKRSLLSLSALVEESLFKAVKAVHDRDIALANQVLDGDEEIDAMEVEVEEECLKILALHQPVAQDLRFVVAVLKINNDLELIGDLACNIAWRAKALADLPPIALQFNVLEMSSKVKAILRKALEALVVQDVEAAQMVCAMDDEIDRMNHTNYTRVNEELKKDPTKSETLLSIMYVSRNLERIGDHTTNIAEDIIYMVEGEIVRHGLNVR